MASRENVVAVWPVIATRDRPADIADQVERLLPQLEEGDNIVVVVDGGEPTMLQTDPKVTVIRLAENVGVYRARRVGNAFVPCDAVICEIDDHDLAEPNLLSKIREAFTDAQVVLAYCDIHLRAADGSCWTTLPKRNYEPGGFHAGNLALGMRAYRKWAYDAVGGYPLDVDPAGDFALMLRLEALLDGSPRHIVRIAEPLVTVIAGNGISGKRRIEQDMQAASLVNQMPGQALPFRAIAPSSVADETRRLAPREPTCPPPDTCGRYRPHLVYITALFGIGNGGGQLSVIRALRAAYDAGWRVTVICEREVSTVHKDLDWLSFACCKKADAKSITEYLNEARADLAVIEGEVHVWDAATAATEAARLPIIGNIQFWRPLVNIHRDGIWEAINGKPEDILPFVDHEGVKRFKTAVAVIANSEVTARWVETITGIKPTIMNPPIDPDAVIVKDAVPVRERRFVTCMSGQQLKGADMFAAMARARPDLEFKIVGGDIIHCRGGIASLDAYEGIPNLVLERGWIGDIREVYAEARAVFIGTQTAETFSRCAAEARANGIPIIATDAGNLPNIVNAGKPGGVIIPRHPSLPECLAALDTALAMDIETDASFCHDDTPKAVALFERHRNLSEVLIARVNAPGIGRAATELARALGVREVEGIPRQEQIDGAALTILPGGFNAAYATILERSQARVGLYWCSHMAQMDTSRHEMEAFVDAFDALGKRPGAYFLTSCRHDAEFLQSLGYANVEWLPLCYAVPAALGLRREPKTVYIPGPYGPRKNIYVALAATRAAGCEANVGEWITRHKEAVAFARHIGLALRVVPIRNCDDVLEMAASSSAALAISIAETFCYSAADCISQETPVLGWAGVPAVAREARHGLVADPGDVEEVAAALRVLVNDPEAAGECAREQRAWLKATVEVHALEARARLRRITERGMA